MNKESALMTFWSSFRWRAYDENSIPSDAEFPYITFESATAEVGHPLALNGFLWNRSLGWSDLVEKSEEIYNSIGYGGCFVNYENGSLNIRRGSPFSQKKSDIDNPDVKRMIINITAEYWTAD